MSVICGSFYLSMNFWPDRSVSIASRPLLIDQYGGQQNRAAY
jgi:hypothetical protein